MKENDYLKKIAKLESINDQLQAEFNHLNLLLKKVGFDEGIKSLKEAANEILDHRSDEKNE
jgi:hypothetical protein